MDIFEKIAEEKIKEAMREGAFDDLEGKGKPVEIEDWSAIPEDLRMSYKILKNAGMVPEEIQLLKDIIGLNDLLDCCSDEEEAGRLRSKLNERMLRYKFLMEQRDLPNSPAFQQYEDKIRSKLRG